MTTAVSPIPLEPRVRLDDPYGALPTRDIQRLFLCPLTWQNSKHNANTVTNRYPVSNPQNSKKLHQLNTCYQAESSQGRTGRSTLTSVPSSRATRQVMTDLASPAAGMWVAALWASRSRSRSACLRMERRPSVRRKKLSILAGKCEKRLGLCCCGNERHNNHDSNC